MADTWKNDGVRIEELEGRVREFERLIAVVGDTAMEMAEQLKQALLVTTAIPVEQTETVGRSYHDGVVNKLKRDVEWFTRKHDEAIAQADEHRVNVTGLGATLSIARQEVKALQQRVTQYEVEAVALRARIADLEKDRDKWRKMVEMEDAEIMGIIGVNDRG
jgi:chromosome condensin MukBEF ATPase and DNA-binding subunit MukB